MIFVSSVLYISVAKDRYNLNKFPPGWSNVCLTDEVFVDFPNFCHFFQVQKHLFDGLCLYSGDASTNNARCEGTFYPPGTNRLYMCAKVKGLSLRTFKYILNLIIFVALSRSVVASLQWIGDGRWSN